MARPAWPLLLLLLACLVASAPARAQDQSTEGKLRDALRRSTVELRALQDQQAAMQAQLDQSQKQRDQALQQVADLTAKLGAQAATPAAPAAPDPAIAELRQEVAGLKQQNAALQQGLAKWQAAYQQAAAAAQAKAAEAHALDGALKTAQGTLGVAQAKNAKLLGTAQDILHLYETQGFRSILLGSYEPLLGLKRVELENIVQDYDDRIRDQQYRAGEQPAPPGARK